MNVRARRRDRQTQGQSCVAMADRSSYQPLAQWLVGSAVALGFVCLSFAVQARSAPESFADLAEELLPSVVNVVTTQNVVPDERADGGEQIPQGENFEEFFRDFLERRGGGQPQQPRPGGAQGSGFIIDASGYIVTNHHVIEGADAVTVRMHDGAVLDAKIVGSDEKTDLALLKVDTELELPATKWGDSDKSRIGDWVVAIGNPFGLGGSVSAGIISARARDINSGPYDDFIQTDAAINRGNSGGPLFNMDGQVIGVNTAIYSPSGGSIGIGFAIPSAMAEHVIQQLRESGEVKRGWLGVHIQTVTEELAEGLRLDEASGALVASVAKDGPAEKAGILQGDVILEFNGRKVPEMRKLPRMVAETPIGREVDVVVWRKGERKTLQVDLGKLSDDVVAAVAPSGQVEETPKSDKVEDLGLFLGTLNDDVRERFQIGDISKGVVITDVVQNSSAAEKNLRPGDVIVEVDQEEVSKPDQVASLVTRAKEAGFRVVTLLVFRQGEYQWVAVKLDS
ncbi:DegQ family serine endoprotease [Kiloniella laminariae]|uniref:DegQ family serine endoprotease n=1 Tax=Kiloniella laminariae TaxID=454162 RepID=UPI001469B05E|nr:DegQ family serine endoprotease [Kiloniella laminariae]